MKKSFDAKKVNWFTILFVIVLVLILIYLVLNIGKTDVEDQTRINGSLILSFALFVGATIFLLRKPFKLTSKNDNYHPENYSDHQEGRYRKNTR